MKAMYLMAIFMARHNSQLNKTITLQYIKTPWTKTVEYEFAQRTESKTYVVNL